MPTQAQAQTSTIAADAVMTGEALAAAIALRSKGKLPSENSAREQASTAFREDKQGSELKGTAEQRMAYALTVHMANQAKDKSNLPGLLCTSDEDKKTLREHLAATFCGDAPKKKKLAQEQGSLKAIETVTAYRNMLALVKRGQMLATICAKHEVAWSAYDTTNNCLVVRASMLLPNGSTPTGRLAKDTWIALDGRPLTFLSIARNGEEFNDGALANVKHLLHCVGPKPKERDVDAETKKEVVAAIKVLHTFFVTEAASDPVIHADFDDDAWNMISSLMLTWETARAAPGFLAKFDDQVASKAAIAFAKGDKPIIAKAA